MCTIGYHSKLKLIFKNRDKSTSDHEVIVVRPDCLAVKTEGADYYSICVNKYGCAIASAAVNTPIWTNLVMSGKHEEAAAQFKKENEGLVYPISVLAKDFHNIKNVDELLKLLLNYGVDFMGYNLLVADKEKAAHLELHRKDKHLEWIDGDYAITNHFQYLSHGPSETVDYPSSFLRLDFAKEKMQGVVSIEDIFHMLKTSHGNSDADLWRFGVFSTISSSVIDLEARSLYYSTGLEQDFTRIAAGTPLSSATKAFIEMSRYIDLPTYHNIERGHPFYTEMIDEIQSQIKQYYESIKSGIGNRIKLKTLEFGAGTGLCSLDLIKHPFLQLDALDFDSHCCKILSSHCESSKYNVILGDAVTYCKPHNYDLVVSTFAHDHIHYNRRFLLASNIYNNLKKGGIYIMGGEILGYFSNAMERKRMLFKYHNFIIDEALRHDRIQLSELENNALKSGLDMVGDFKRHEAMFEEEMESAGLVLISKKKIGPIDRDDVGGVYVYVYRAE